MKIACEKAISRPPEAVFPWIADPDRAMRWQKNVKGGQVLVRTDRVVGTTFTERVEENGRGLEMRGEITGYVENRSMAFHLESPIHTVDVTYDLKDTGGQTTASVAASIAWKFPMNVASLLLRKRMVRQLVGEMESELAELARLCEAESPPLPRPGQGAGRPLPGP